MLAKQRVVNETRSLITNTDWSIISSNNTALLSKELDELGLDYILMIGRYNGVSEVNFLVWTENDKLINILAKYHKQEAVIHKCDFTIEYVEIINKEHYEVTSYTTQRDITFSPDNAFQDNYSAIECSDGDLYFQINFDS